ncbi:MAG TPA: ImmA/IrrE family metallo-endopeptidase [Pirellulales bacterium]|nr:ImmA/IrrE family metallo-endopeptidase [Pirellulales bacterium]
MVDRTALAQDALQMALEVRERAGIDFGTPLNVFDLCDRLSPKVRVLFVDYNMEGCYLRSSRPLIQVSALRPLPRRVFNCAHELGHHVFGHGSTIDELQEDSHANPRTDPNEFLVNAFAGFLLMPKLGVRRAFTARKWSLNAASPEQLYVVACHFGVGYETIVSHLAYGLGEIGTRQAEKLRRAKLPAIRRALLGSDAAERLIVADQHYALAQVDAEVGTFLLLPAGSEPEYRTCLTPIGDLSAGRLFRAERAGLSRVEAPGQWAVVVRISPYQYAGWSQYRHLAREEGDDE